jgi:flagellar basal-body rod modification protein FlgD
MATSATNAVPTNTTATAAATATSTISTSSTAQMGKDDFLNLLVTQLRYQDPMSPADPKDFVAQLSQFSSVEQLMNVNTNLDGLSKSFQTMGTGLQVTQGLAYLGKQVTASGNLLQVKSGKATPASFTLPLAAKSATVSILNGAGQVVRTLNLGAQTAGSHDIAWDGLNSQGKAAADGQYTFQISATDTQGQAITATTSFTGTVTGLVQNQGQVQLKVGDRLVDLSSITAVLQGS